MNEWKSFCLGDVCNICSSKRIFAREYTKQGIPFYRGKEIIEKHNKNKVSNTLYISEKRYLEVKSKYDVPKIGDILLTSVGTLGIAWFIDESNFYFKDGNLTWLRASDLIDSKFLYWWLNSKEAQEQIERKCIGTTQKALTIETLNKFTIFLPPLDTQKKVAAVLSALDDKIELNNAINKNLEEQAQAIFKSWFIDFEPFGGTMPDDWRQGRVEEIVVFHDSKRIPLSANERKKMKKIYPYYGATSIIDYVEDYIFNGIFLLFAEDGTVIDDKGFPILQYVEGKFWVNNHAHILTGQLGFSVETLYLLFRTGVHKRLSKV